MLPGQIKKKKKRKNTHTHKKPNQKKKPQNPKGSKKGREREVMAVLSVLLHFVISKKHLSMSPVATSLVV